jgi:hypothetical protein
MVQEHGACFLGAVVGLGGLNVTVEKGDILIERRRGTL